jgi:hypothetical protein
MTLGIGTLPTRTRQPVRVITSVYPVQSREQRRLLARNAGHMGRLAALGVALLITAVAVFAAGGGSGGAQASSAGGLPVIAPEARSAPPSWACQDVALRSGLCSASFFVETGAEGRA